MDLAGKSASFPRRPLLNRPSRRGGANRIGLCLPAPSAYSPLDHEMRPIGIAIIGCGGVTLQNHLPGFALGPEARVVALCDTDPATLERARQQTGIALASTRHEEIVQQDEVNAVVIATPNFTHAPIALSAIAAGKHVPCENAITMNYGEARAMSASAATAAVRRIT